MNIATETIMEKQSEDFRQKGKTQRAGKMYFHGVFKGH